MNILSKYFLALYAHPSLFLKILLLPFIFKSVLSFIAFYLQISSLLLPLIFKSVLSFIAFLSLNQYYLLLPYIFILISENFHCLLSLNQFFHCLICSSSFLKIPSLLFIFKSITWIPFTQPVWVVFSSMFFISPSSCIIIRQWLDPLTG